MEKTTKTSKPHCRKSNLVHISLTAETMSYLNPMHVHWLQHCTVTTTPAYKLKPHVIYTTCHVQQTFCTKTEFFEVLTSGSPLHKNFHSFLPVS